MKIEVNIDKKILLVVLGIFLIGAGVYATVSTSLPYHDASQVRLNNGDSVQDSLQKIQGLSIVNCTPEITYRDYTGDNEACTVTMTCSNGKTKNFGSGNYGHMDDSKCWDIVDPKMNPLDTSDLTNTGNVSSYFGKRSGVREWIFLEIG